MTTLVLKRIQAFQNVECPKQVQLLFHPKVKNTILVWLMYLLHYSNDSNKFSHEQQIQKLQEHIIRQKYPTGRKEKSLLTVENLIIHDFEKHCFSEMIRRLISLLQTLANHPEDYASRMLLLYLITGVLQVRLDACISTIG